MTHLVVPIVGDFPARCMVVEITEEYISWLLRKIAAAGILLGSDERFREVHYVDRDPIFLRNFPRRFDPWSTGYDQRGWVLDDDDDTLSLTEKDRAVERFLWAPEVELLTGDMYAARVPRIRVWEDGLLWSMYKEGLSPMSPNIEYTTRSISKRFLQILGGMRPWAPNP